MKIKQHSVKIMALTLMSVSGLVGGIVSTNTDITSVRAISVNDPLSRIAPHGRETITVHDNQATFSSGDINRLNHHQSILEGSDRLGRNGTAEAKLSEKTAKKPGEPRQSISDIKPVGWLSGVYVTNVNGKSVPLYNRCHLLAYALNMPTSTNPDNFITGTEYFNQKHGMEKYENRLIGYIREHPNADVYYRVIPIYRSNELLARGVDMQAYTPSDSRDKNANFNVYVFNREPGIKLDYQNGGNPKSHDYTETKSAKDSSPVTPKEYKSDIKSDKKKSKKNNDDDGGDDIEKDFKEGNRIGNKEAKILAKERKKNDDAYYNETKRMKDKYAKLWGLPTSSSDKSDHKNHSNNPSDLSAYAHRNADTPSSDHKSDKAAIPATGRQQSHVSELISAAGISLIGIIAMLFTGFKIRHKKDNQIR